MVVHHAAHSSIREAVVKYFPKVPSSGKEYESKRLAISRWKREAEEIRAGTRQAPKASAMRVRAKGIGIVMGVLGELQLVRWINDLRRDGIPVSSALLRERALEIAADRDIPRHLFMARRSWRKSFLARHRFSFRARMHQGQETIADAQAQFKMQAPKRRDIVDWVARAWTQLRQTTIANGFRACGIVLAPATPSVVSDTEAPTEATDASAVVAELVRSRHGMQDDDCFLLWVRVMRILKNLLSENFPVETFQTYAFDSGKNARISAEHGQSRLSAPFGQSNLVKRLCQTCKFYTSGPIV